MASNVKFTVEGKGKNLKKTSKEANDLAKGTERAGKGMQNLGNMSNTTRKNLNGVAGTSSNVTKNFSKMQQGSSGLVAAYATLAGNLFAAQAAFNALRKAAQLDSVIAALEETGAAAGRNLGLASDKLREVTGNAISAEQALRTTALGVSSGFSTDQLEGLATVARGASIALGRDMGDALDRLTRGTAKLEPEILDELGIMVRLDDATAEYAATIGKSVNDLSQYERRQAFLNATLEQGTKKFGELATSVEVNQYDQLASTLADLSKSFLTVINDGIKPLVSLMAQSQGVLIGTIVMFASTIAKQLLPSMASLGSKTLDQVKADAQSNTERLKNLKITKKLPADYRNAAKAMAEGKINQQQFDKALRSTSSSITRHEGGLRKMSLATLAGVKDFTKKTFTLYQVKRARESLIRAMQQQMTIQARENAANALGLIGQGNLIKGFGALGRSIALYSRQTMLATKSGNLLTKTMGFMKIGAFGLGMALRGVGSAVMAMLGPIGMIVSVGMMVYEMFKDKFVQAKPVQEEADKIIESLDHIDKVASKFQDKINASGATSADTIVAGYKALGGVLQEIQSGLGKVQAAHVKTKRTAMDQAQAEIDAAQRVIDQNKNKAKENRRGQTTQAGRLTKEANKTIVEQTALLEQAKGEMNKLAPGEFVRVLDEANDKLANSGAFGEFSSIGTAALTKIKNDMKDTELSMEDVNKIINDTVRPIMNVAGAFDGARDAASQFRKEQTKLAVKAKTPFDGVIDGAEGMLKQLNVVEDAIAEMAQTGGDATDLNAQKETLMAEINKQMGVEKLTGTGDLEAYVEQLIGARKELLKHTKAMKGLQIEQKLLNKLDKQGRSVGTIKALIANEKAMFKQRITGAQATLDLNNLALGTVDQANIEEKKREIERMTKAKEFGAERQALINEVERLEEKSDNARTANIKAQADMDQALYEQKIANATETFRITVREKEELIEVAKQQQKIAELTSARTKQVQALIKARSEATLLDQPGATGEESLSKGQELVNAQATQKIREEGLLEEHRLRNLMIDLEFQLLDAKTALFQAELIAKQAEGKISDVAYSSAFAASANALNNAREIAKMQKANSDRQLLIDQQVMKNEDKKLQLQAQTERRAAGQGAASAYEALAAIQEYDKAVEDASIAAQTAIRDDVIAQFAASVGKDAVAGVYDFTKEQFAELQTAIKTALNEGAATSIGTAGATGVSVGASSGTAGIEAEAPEASTGLNLFKDQLATTDAVLGPMIDKFKTMGPEGEVVAAVTGGALAIGNAYTEMATTLEANGSKTEQTAAKLKFAGAVVGQIGNMMAAQSQAKIAGIDQEIAAEKKRDGKSKESQAKIRALEAKKEKEKKKAFERNKKMQMAQVIIDTAAGAMKAVGQAGLFGIPMVPMIIAMGAAQLAMIASQSYQGGGGSMGGGASAPAKVTMGSRQNQVDVATGPGRAAGELAYMRGARGQGTSASTFTPSFTGRYRAAGGAAYIVGEQGPEVFVPEVPGRIVSNDDMREGGGVPINATFNISAIDATNMEQTLTAQRGNIIGMIREAANSSGESFLESVDTLALGESRGYSAN